MDNFDVSHDVIFRNFENFKNKNILAFPICSIVRKTPLILQTCQFGRLAANNPKLQFRQFWSNVTLSTNGVTSAGVTLLVPGSLVLVMTRVLPLFLDVSSESSSGFVAGLLGPVFLFLLGCISEFVMITNSPDCCYPSMVLLFVLTTPNRSEEPVSPLVGAPFS